MKKYFLKTISLFILVLIFIGFNSKSEKKQPVRTKFIWKNPNTDNTACNILTKDYLLGEFPGAENFKPFSKKKPYPSCSFRFKYNGKNYKVGLTLVKKYASEKNLDKAVSYFKEKESLHGVGKKAYYIPKQGQVSLFNNNYLAHVYVTINEKGNKNLAIQITTELIEKIDN